MKKNLRLPALLASAMLVFSMLACISSPAATPTTQPTATPEEVAPDPLPATHTGIVLIEGDCFDFDTGAISVPDQNCDVYLAAGTLFQQMNGAQVSGYVTMDAPTRSYCLANRYETGDLAIQTDLFMCFISNAGRVGFVVAREYRGMPATGIVMDYWVFR